MSILDQKLTRDAQRDILGNLLDYSVNDDGVIFDADGDEFYAQSGHDEFDLTTLRGIFGYIEHTAEEYGRQSKTIEIRKILGGNNDN